MLQSIDSSPWKKIFSILMCWEEYLKKNKKVLNADKQKGLVLFKRVKHLTRVNLISSTRLTWHIRYMFRNLSSNCDGTKG